MSVPGGQVSPHPPRAAQNPRITPRGHDGRARAPSPCEFQGWHTSPRSVGGTPSVLLGKDEILDAGLPFQKFHALSLDILFD